MAIKTSNRRETLTSRRRLLKAINHEEPDRAPIDLGGNQTGIHKFGEQLVFWGGAIDAQHVLPTASPETVREHVRRNLEIWKPGGGYVFNNVHNIQADVPAENIVAPYEAAYEYGFYA